MKARFITFQPQVRPAKTALPSPAALLSSTVTTSARSTAPFRLKISPGSQAMVTPSGPKCSARMPVYASRSSGRWPCRMTAARPPPALTSRSGQPASITCRAMAVAAERRQVVVEQMVADVKVDRVDSEVVGARHGERLVEALRVDAELGRLVAAVVADAALGAGGADAGVDADADRAPAIPPPVPVDLADEVEVHVDAALEDHVEVAVAHVGAGVADLGGWKAVGEAVLDLSRRADVEADELGSAGRAECVEARPALGLALALERPADLPRQAGARHRPLQGAHVLLDVGEVVDEQRRAVLAGQRLGVTAGDEQAAATGP